MVRLLYICVYVVCDSRANFLVAVAVDLNKQLKDNYVKACKFVPISCHCLLRLSFIRSHYVYRDQSVGN